MAYKIFFFGTSDFSVPSLEALLDDPRFTVAGVVTKPDAPIGRHQTMTPPPVKTMALENNVEVLQFDKVKTDETFNVLKQLQDELEIDAYVVVSYGKIIPQRVLDLPKEGAINVHGSLLPRWRGASCVQAAIAAGDEKSGVTIMLMDAEMDRGDVLAQKEVEIGKEETGGELHDRLAELGASALPDVLFEYLEDNIKPEPQDHSQATFCKILKREDGKIDWSKSAAEIERLVRAYNPWPCTWTEWDNKRIKILKARSPLNPPLIKGEAMGIPEVVEEKLFIQCGDGKSLEILELQPEGKRTMTAKEYLAGHR
ncbi:MAG: methionyl-tRNA formyltransferase [Patescibacteria group bacterium]|nr:methionyl-tRNA formyltransferase [Patescibacteria group bacterium]